MESLWSRLDPCDPQVKWTDFSDDKEAEDYVESEAVMSHGVKKHATNWRLNKYYYIAEKGLDKDNTAEVIDELSREALDEKQGLCALGHDAQPSKGKKELPPKELHRFCREHGT